MSQFEFINEIDLYRAYKKTKFELFSDKNSVLTLKLFNFEKDLKNNISDLCHKLQKNGLNDICVGSFFEYPKSLKLLKSKINKEEFCKDASLENCCEEEKVHFFSSSLDHHEIKEQQKYELEFRKIIDAELEFHIISTLWVMKIGQYIDEKFSKDIYGSRLIRSRPTDTSSCEYDLSNQKFNIDSPRIYEQYQYKYQNWRNNSFKSIRELHKTSSVIAITMDISKFYHSINPKYFLTPKFYEEFDFDKKIDSEWKQFHEEFINKIIKWNSSLARDEEQDEIVGIPIGLTASPILANAIMKEFDVNINSIAPTYYGRYVDDILLVFPDNGELNSGEEVLEYLKNRNVINKNAKDDDFVLYKDIENKGIFTLKKSKQKIFYLDKNADLSIIDGMEAEINSVSSEWRFLPDIADKNSSLLNKIIGFYGDGKEFNDALRKIDSTTIKRLGLSLLISHAHSLNEYITSKEWSEKRYKIYDLIENHIFIPENFINNYAFISRLFRLMIHSGDGERAFCFLQKVNKLIKNIERIQKQITSNGQVKFSYFERYHKLCFREVFLESINCINIMKEREIQKIIDLLFLEDTSNYDITTTDMYDVLKTTPLSQDGLISFEDIHISIDKLTGEEIKFINSHLFLRDLSFDGFGATVTKFLLTKSKKSLIKKINGLKQNNISLFDIDISSNEKKDYLNSINQLIKAINKELNCDLSNLPLIFSTRLLTPLDLSIILNKEDSTFLKIVNAVRGNNSLSEDKEEKSNLKSRIQKIDNKKLNNVDKVNIAITNFQVEDNYWKDSVIEKPNKTLKRFQQLEEVVNEAVRKRPDYLVLPELAIPQEWAWLISKKLLVNNISLITGVEYIHGIDETKQKIVHNSVMMFLISDNLGYNYLKFYRQDKTVAAYQEGIDLYEIAKIKLVADDNSKYDVKDIYQHGNFFFSTLICNELTDIHNRARLRGEIDNLFVIEWNRDVNSFNSYVESAALDIHSYVVQVNNRKYGDSRIRAPYKESFYRDIVQVKGGRHDYLIVGEIDIKSLREFQSHNISPKQPFKPTPTGFKMSKEREKWVNNF